MNMSRTGLGHNSAGISFRGRVQMPPGIFLAKRSQAILLTTLVSLMPMRIRTPVSSMTRA
ncbi:hypothetical protein D3C76_1525100 [compost metagenome]